jgi:hypothetical protein
MWTLAADYAVRTAVCGGRLRTELSLRAYGSSYGEHRLSRPINDCPRRMGGRDHSPNPPRRTDTLGR